jgi:predicted ATPase
MPFEGGNQIKDLWEAKQAKIQETREVNEAHLSVGFDREKMGNIDIAPFVQNTMFDPDGEEKKAATERIQGLLERYGRLPESIEFKPGITLIVGENGHGKTTFAKALLYATKKQYEIEYEGLSPESAEEEVFNPRGGMASDIFELRKAKLATTVARAIDVSSLVVRGEKWGKGVEYVDFTTAAGESTGQEYWAIAHTRGTSANPDDVPLNHKSHRQTLDQQIVEGRKHEAKRGRPVVTFLDEPESGMSPRRQKQLEREIEEMTASGSVVIVVTNSVSLFDSDLPRIDLEYPERGIFRPSEYPETEN